MNGKLYGTTSGGGGSADHGTVFSVTPSGTERRLYSFQGGTDAEGPEAPLVDVNGTLYGTSTIGGGSACGGNGCGTVFAVSRTGSENVSSIPSRGARMGIACSLELRRCVEGSMARRCKAAARAAAETGAERSSRSTQRGRSACSIASVAPPTARFRMA